MAVSAMTVSLLAAPQATRAAGWSIQSLAADGAGQALVGVSCVSSSACMAVGDNVTLCPYVAFVCRERAPAFAERWDGLTWSVLPAGRTPSPSTSTLSGVSCTSATACTAVGVLRRPGGSQALVERWNGTNWNVQAIHGLAPGSRFLGVSCSSGSACVAVGTQGSQALAAQWNGRHWIVRPAPGAELDAVSCLSHSRCFAVGLASSPSLCPLTLVDHWNGKRWATSYRIDFRDCQNGDKSRLTGLSCLPSGFCASVGYACCDDAYGGPFPILAHWTRKHAQAAVGAYAQVGEGLGGVSCATAMACTAVGSSDGTEGNPHGTLVEQWNGTHWTIVPTPNPNGIGGGLQSVSCVSAAACTAVGTFYTTAEVALVESTNPVAAAAANADRSNGTQPHG
jgi:hypothetical protein